MLWPLIATWRLSTGLGSTSSSCLPSDCLYSAPTFWAISALPPSTEVSSGCHLDQFLASPSLAEGSPPLLIRTAATISAAATHTPASEPSRKPKRLRYCEGPVGTCAGCAAERGGSGASSMRFGVPLGPVGRPAGEGGGIRSRAMMIRPERRFRA